MPLQETIRETIQKYFDANNALDVEAYVEVFADDAAMYNAGEISPLSGLVAIRNVAEQTLQPFRETHVAQERTFISGNGAAVFYTGHMTTRDGRSAHVEGIDVFEINEDGKIQSIRFYFNPAPLIALFQGEVSL